MSIRQACAEVEAAIGRARSLFGDTSAAEVPGGATDLDRAAQTAAKARARTVGLSGNGIDAYQSVVDRSVGLLTTAAASDRTLATHMTTAAAVTQSGAVRLDHIAAQTREISRVAAGAKTPAEERIILTALRSQLTQTSQVVQSTQQKATELAGHIRTLKYPADTPGSNGIQAVDNLTDHGKKGPVATEGPVAGDMSSGDINQIDLVNRAALQSMLDEYSQLPDGQVKTDRLADIAAIREALKVPDSHLIYVARPDNPADMIPAATAVGDPFTADHVSVTVPGVSGATRGSIAGMTREASGLREEARAIARKVGESQNVATIAWAGYQPPPVITSWDTVSDDLAQTGAPKLESFLQNLDAGSHNPGHTTALFGHSYGSLLSGIALKDGASSLVDNAVLYGSPGFEASSPAQLGMTDHNFFVMSAQDDPIRPIGQLAPVHGWGSDPNDVIGWDRYRFTHLQTHQGWVQLGDESVFKTGASGHSQYGQDPLQRMTGYNLATILLDRPDLAAQQSPR